MTDKERIYAAIIRELCTTQLLCHHAHDEALFNDPMKRSGQFTHFKFEGCGLFHQVDIPIGSLVLCQTSGIHEFTIGWLEQNEGETYILREIGTGRLGQLSNDTVIPIVGLNPDQLWERDEYQFSVKVQKALRRADSYSHRMRRLDMGHPATLWIDKVWGGVEQYPITIEWDKHTSIKAILEQMVAQGFGTREFTAMDEEREGRDDET